MSSETTQSGTCRAAGKDVAAVCHWIISPIGWGYRECGAMATQFDPETGTTLCDSHADEYAEAFGWESLRSIRYDAQQKDAEAAPEVKP